MEGLKIDADGNVVYEDWKLNEIIFKGKDVFIWCLFIIELGFSFENYYKNI